MVDSPSQRLRRARLRASFASAANFARLVGVELPTYRSHENGNRGFGTEDAQRYAQALGCSAAWLLFGDETPAPLPPPERVVDVRAAPDALAFDPMDMIPIKSAARGGDEQEMTLTDALGHVPRPTALRGVKQAYAVQVVNDSMSPRYRPGVIVHVNPWKTPRQHLGVVVYKRNDSVLIKEFVRQTSTELLLRQHNPPLDLRIPLAEIRECHVVVGTDETGA